MTQLKPRVFLSHSGNDGLVSDVLDKLESALDAAGYEPLLDRRHILDGVEFAPEIDKFIRTCDAAVFIINRRALKRENGWVRNEANQLRQKMTGANFQAVPIFLGVKPGKLGRDWEAAGIAQRNGIESNDPDAIAAAVVVGLAPTLRRVRADQLVWALERRLRRISSDNALERAAVPIGGWVPGMLRLEIARRLLEATQAQIVEVASALVLEDRRAAIATLRFALPHTWVDRGAAQVACEAIKRCRVAVLNTDELETAKAHMVCGWTDYPPWELDLQGFPPQGELEAMAVEEAATARLEFSSGRLPSDAQPRATSAERSAPAGPPNEIVLTFKCPRLEPAIIDAVEGAARKENAPVLLLAPYATWEDVAEDVRDRVVLLDPELDRARERKALRVLRDAKKMLERRLKQDDFYSWEDS